MNLFTILASGDDGNAGGGGALIQLGIFLLIPLAMYFLLIRPQRRRVKDQQALQSSLEVGDEIVTTSGMYGFITGFEDGERVWIEIDDNVQVRVARAAIQGKVDTSATSATATAPPAAPPKDARDRDEADNPVDADATDKE